MTIIYSMYCPGETSYWFITASHHCVMHFIVFLYILATILTEFQSIAQAGPILNDQIQVVHHLKALNSYKDAQIIRFQIPSEMSVAHFRLNATHSEETLLNTTRISVREHLKRVGDHVLGLPTTPAPPVIHFTESDHGSPQPNRTGFDWKQFINVAMVEEYANKAVKLYNTLRLSACRKAVNVTIVLRWASLPLLDIKNAAKPQNFMLKNSTDQYKITLSTNKPEIDFKLNNPLPGDWYGMVFIDRTNNRIVQKGLERECFYRFIANLHLEPIRSDKHALMLAGSSQLPVEQSLIVERSHQIAEHFYKFFPTSSDLGAKIIIRNCHTNVNKNQNNNSNNNVQLNNCPLVVNFRSLAYPNTTVHDFNFTCQSSTTNDNSGEPTNNKCIIDLPSIAPNEWNYLQIIPSWQKARSQQTNYYNNHNTNNHNFYGKSLHSHADSTLTGTVNYTIQILLGQDAYLYSYFNDQRCSQFSASGSNPSFSSNIVHKQAQQTNNNLESYRKNFGIVPGSLPAREDHAHMIGGKANDIPQNRPTVNEHHHQPKEGVASVVVPNVKSSSLSKDVHEVKHPAPVKMNLTEPKAMDSIDFVEEEVEDEEMEKELDKSSLSQFVKRAVDFRDQKKKPENRKGKGQGQKKDFKNKVGRKKQQEHHDGEHCHFDPKQILATLDEDDLGNLTAIAQVNLTRYQSGAAFEFRYVHTLNLTKMVTDPTGNSTAKDLIEVDNDRPTLLNFTVSPGVDIGGNLLIDFAIAPQTRNRYQNYSAVLCLTHNRLPPILASAPGTVRFDELCYGHLISNTSTANFTAGYSDIQRLAVPFPQAGTWFVSIVVRCYTNEDTPEDLLSAMNMDYSGYSCEYTNSTQVMLNIRSSGCLESRCLNGGKCAHYLNNGVQYSTCICRSGWKGLVCDDGSAALSNQKVMLNFIFLVASNGAFLPAILVTICRRYFTEATVYLVTMIFSALYHACETDSPHSICIADHRLLQFGDFYTATLSFFVTLITLANLSPPCKSFLHLFGAVLIAIVTQHDCTNLLTFILPATIAMMLLFCCWCSQCCRRSCYPRARCWIFSVCPALILTIVGLLIYAFLETEDNYPITHSLWHVIVGTALLFAIPSMPDRKPIDDEEEEEEERVHFMGSTSSSGAGSGKGSSAGLTNAKMAHVEWRPPHSSFKFLNDDIDML